MKIGLSQSARMEQRLLQSPQMIQAMQILQLSALDLEERIQQELVENPFLEVVERTAPEREADETHPAPGPASAEERGVSSMMDELERYERDFGDGPPRPRGSPEDADRKLEAMANTPAGDKTLAEVLIDELAWLDFDRRRRALAEYLLWSLDERGWLTEPLAQIAHDCMHPKDPDDDPVVAEGEPPVTEEELAAVLQEIRSISHPALGARDLSECLTLQLDAMGLPAGHLLRAIVARHLPDVEQNRLPRIAKETGHSIEDVKDAIDTLRRLEPSPGAGFGGAQADVIHPDVVVEEIDGEYEVRLSRGRAPELRLSPAYKDVLAAAQKGDGVREWVKKRIESARWFMDALQQRRSTLELIAQAVFRRQRGFLERGVEGLKPLRMQEIADEVGVHISTVSRAVAGKHAQTPRGIFPLKYFFTGGTTTEAGDVESQAAVQQKIAELVGGEDASAPLSDEELARLLEERHQIRLARRTVTKYRKALKIPSSSQRRRF